MGPRLADRRRGGCRCDWTNCVTRAALAAAPTVAPRSSRRRTARSGDGYIWHVDGTSNPSVEANSIHGSARKPDDSVLRIAAVWGVKHNGRVRTLGASRKTSFEPMKRIDVKNRQPATQRRPEPSWQTFLTAEINDMERMRATLPRQRQSSKVNSNLRNLADQSSRSDH